MSDRPDSNIETVPFQEALPQVVSAQELLDLSQGSREQLRRQAEARAREQVGAAGWQQTSLLEEIIRAGRDQFASTDALRQEVRQTTESLRGLPLSAGQGSRDEQQQALERLVEVGHQQIGSAHELEEVIQQALREIAQTPLPDLNAQQLQRVLGRVREQIGALDLLIEVARAQVGTLEQLQTLDLVSAAYQQRLQEMRTLNAEDELDRLGELAVETVERIAGVSAAGEKQLETLGDIGGAVVQQVTATTASRDDQLETLESIQLAAVQQAEQLRSVE